MPRPMRVTQRSKVPEWAGAAGTKIASSRPWCRVFVSRNLSGIGVMLPFLIGGGGEGENDVGGRPWPHGLRPLAESNDDASMPHDEDRR